MSEESPGKSWLDGGFDEELAKIDQQVIEAFEVESEAQPYEKPLGFLTEEEKPVYVLAALYRIATDEAYVRKDIPTAIRLGLRTKFILARFYYRLAERLKAWDEGVEELGIRNGWKVVGLTPEACEKRDQLEEFAAEDSEEGLRET